MAAQPIKQRYVQITDRLFNSEAFRTLPGAAMKLWVDVRTAYFGVNNGRLVITLAVLRNRGWNSTDKLLRARDKLLERGLIVRTRYCGKNAYQRASWYAFTDIAINKDDKNGISGAQASHAYSLWKPASSGLREQEERPSGNRKDALPKTGRQSAETLPDLGKRQSAQEGASLLRFAPFCKQCARFPISGHTNICSFTNVSAGNGAHTAARVKSETKGGPDVSPLLSDATDQKNLTVANSGKRAANFAKVPDDVSSGRRSPIP